MTNEQFDRINGKAFEIIWAALGIGALAGVIFAGAYWHLFTVGICALMYLAQRAENRKDEKRNGRA